MEEQNKPQPNTGKQNIKTLHTYEGDMADAIRQNEMSVIKIALAEQAKHEREDIYRKAEGSPLQKIVLLIGGLLLLSGACGGLYYLIQKKNIDNTVPQIAKNVEAIISYDSSVYIDTPPASSDTEFVKIVRPEIEKGNKSGSIKSIFLTRTTNGTNELLSVKEFLALLGTSAPSTLTRSFEDQYMIGTYQEADLTKKPHLFLIFKTKDYNIAYASMLQWEKSILSDMFSIFDIDIQTDTTVLETPFKDIIINNKDARVLYTKENTDVLYYIFPNKETLIITDSQEALREVLARLLIKETKPL